MTTKTAKERVLEAVTKGLELVSALNQGKLELLKAKQAEDEVRLADRTKEIAEQVGAVQATVGQDAEAELQDALASARKPLEVAQARFDRAAAAAREVRDRVQAGAKAQAEGIILKAQQEQETRSVIARAGVHTAQQEVANMEAGIDRYARQVEQQLGINLKQLLSIARE